MATELSATAESAAAQSAAALIDSSSGPRGRPSWSGLLRLSLVAIPIKAYPVLNRAAAIEFNQLHARCGRRIQYHKHCPV
ncbi:MAG: hypothetical protein HY040_04625, partial [Planctomycetes bacterium]|nr:hypothetical protein [Planctomycetota bacterium]